SMRTSLDRSHRPGGLWFGPAEMPVLFEQRHVQTFMIGMAEHFIQDQIHTQARSFRNFNVTLYNSRRIGDELFLPGFVEVIEHLLQPGVRSTYVDLDASHRADRTLCGVRNNQPIVRIDHVRDLARTEDSAHMEGLKINDIDLVVLKELCNLLLGGKAFARRNG